MPRKESGEPIHHPVARPSGDNPQPPRDEQRETPIAADEGVDMSPVDIELSPPHGVGESVTRRGEDIVDSRGDEAGRKHAGTESKAERPAGTSDARDATSVDPKH